METTQNTTVLLLNQGKKMVVKAKYNYTRKTHSENKNQNILCLGFYRLKKNQTNSSGVYFYGTSIS